MRIHLEPVTWHSAKYEHNQIGNHYRGICFVSIERHATDDAVQHMTN